MDTLAEITEVARLRAERDHLTARHAAASQEVELLEERVQQASQHLAAERRDVEKLESMSLTRVLSAVRGRRLDDLDREQAEARAAEYAYATEHARWQAALREQAELVRRLNGLGLLDERWAAALSAREAELAPDSVEGARLAEVAEATGRLEADRQEVVEALTACRHAGQVLAAAAKHLGQAGNWATYDTFFGGGLMADMVKHQKLDRAAELLRDADAALHHLATELADVGIGPVGGVGVTELTKVFDVWFDNIFSDWSVATRIDGASRRVNHTLQTLAHLDAELCARLSAIDERRTRLAQEREELLQA
ncbi:hypothetical protein IEQ44_08485 [Nocardioides sp. Y6]|uniref:Uncharacterized protein n=1 Tax=Nocardioides malaquae TaxID=2773426 RepID=A0ABR9RSY7_9ACTN|nr:hypothetical protein [Nocardioides malaquae]MBE7324688.1 hypothetical protein [Nocardioides malaquae]